VDVIQALKTATSRVAERYFWLSVAGQGAPVKRERVYCYELYHQLRCLLPAGGALTLSAEPDKRGHPDFQGRQPNPDLIFHEPGTHRSNQAVIEVECRPDRRHLRKDFETFRLLKDKGYREFVLLLFGVLGVPWQRLAQVAEEVGLPLEEVAVLLHQAPGQEATRESGGTVPNPCEAPGYKGQKTPLTKNSSRQRQYRSLG